jgi:hypothetical protein
MTNIPWVCFGIAGLLFLGAVEVWIFKNYWGKNWYAIVGGIASLFFIIGTIGLVAGNWDQEGIKYIGIGFSVLAIIGAAIWFGVVGDSTAKSEIAMITMAAVGLGVVIFFNNRVTEFTVESLGFKASMNEVKQEAKGTLNELREQSKFHSILLRAQNDDRKAYDELIEFTKSENTDFAMIAKSVEASIKEKYVNTARHIFSPNPLNGSIDPDSCKKQDLIPLLNITSRNLKYSFIQRVWNRTDLRPAEKLEFLLDIVMNTDSLMSLYNAEYILSKHTGIKQGPFESKVYLDWWGKNKDNDFDKK